MNRKRRYNTYWNPVRSSRAQILNRNRKRRYRERKNRERKKSKSLLGPIPTFIIGDSIHITSHSTSHFGQRGTIINFTRHRVIIALEGQVHHPIYLSFRSIKHI